VHRPKTTTTYSASAPDRHRSLHAIIKPVRWAAIVPLTLTTIASAQALISPSDAERERQQFAARSDEMALKCDVTPVAPTVNLALRTEAGYIIHVPRWQYSRPTSGWTVFTAITPEQGTPAYLLAHNTPAQAMNTGPKTDSNFDIPVAYFLGAGRYTVETTIRDSDNLVCRRHWKVDVAPAHVDRAIPLALAPSIIEDYARAGLPISGHPDDVPPRRVTILLDAATFSLRRTVIVDRDRERMIQSLTALVEHLPAASLNITAFSLEQQREIFQASAFGAQDLVRLNTAIADTPQASVDINVLPAIEGQEFYRAFRRRNGRGDSQDRGPVVAATASPSAFLSPGSRMSEVRFVLQGGQNARPARAGVRWADRPISKSKEPIASSFHGQNPPFAPR
jgi:hypothetical protein